MQLCAESMVFSDAQWFPFGGEIPGCLGCGHNCDLKSELRTNLPSTAVEKRYSLS